MRYGSLFTGVGGFDLGLELAGLECAWQCEIDGYRRKVLARHWPDVERFEDVRDIQAQRPHSRDMDNGHGSSAGDELQPFNARYPVDLICGGFPCQDLSVAGQRRGLSGSRSGLFFEFARVLAEVRPEWCLIENVPGLLSSNGGRDFGVILDTLGDIGYGVAWRILDSRYFGVPQRRRRVFIVGCLGRPDRAAAVLFEPQGSGGDSQASGEARQDVAYALNASVRGTGDGHGNAWNSNYVANTLQSSGQSFNGWRGNADETYVPEVVGAIDGTFGHHGLAHSVQSASAGHYIAEDDVTAYLPSGAVNNSGTITKAWANSQIGNAQSDSAPLVMGFDALNHTTSDRAATLANDKHRKDYLQSGAMVRRLTPTECLRLQAFPDDWLDGVEAGDGPRYAALGDAVTVSVAYWLGLRLLAVSRV